MMKAKNILLYSAMAGMALSLSSCGDDFLSVDPASSLPIDGYYNTKAHTAMTNATPSFKKPQPSPNNALLKLRRNG